MWRRPTDKAINAFGLLNPLLDYSVMKFHLRQLFCIVSYRHKGIVSNYFSMPPFLLGQTCFKGLLRHAVRKEVGLWLVAFLPSSLADGGISTLKPQNMLPQGTALRWIGYQGPLVNGCCLQAAQFPQLRQRSSVYCRIIEQNRQPVSIACLPVIMMHDGSSNLLGHHLKVFTCILLFQCLPPNSSLNLRGR